MSNTIASSLYVILHIALQCIAVTFLYQEFLSVLVFRNWGNRFAWRAKTQIIPDCPLFDDCYYSSVVFISESNGAQLQINDSQDIDIQTAGAAHFKPQLKIFK